jgi:YbbR domain-containing protein
VSRVAVTPPTVGLRGPRTEVEGRTEIQTAPVDVSGARAPVTRAVELAPAPGAVRLTTRTVEVTVEIREARGMHQRRTVR